MDNTTFCGKIDSIQLLRAVASTGIALFHIQCFYTTGLYLEFGVHLFFIISAFLMMYTTQQAHKKYFLGKRMLRIAPLYWMLTIATFVAMKVFPNLMDTEGDIKSLICSLLFIPYARDGIRGVGVIRPLVGPAWTLYYEVLFTVVFAFAMKISHKYRGIITGCVLASLLACGLMFEIESAPLLFWTRDYWADFIAGIVVFYILKKLYPGSFLPVTRYVLVTIAIIAMGVMCWGGFCEPRWVIFAILGSLAVILFLLGMRDICIPSVLIKVGDISFSFYMFHYYVIILVGKFINLDSFSVNAIIGTALIFAITYALAYISHLVIEDRFTGLIKKS